MAGRCRQHQREVEWNVPRSPMQHTIKRCRKDVQKCTEKRSVWHACTGLAGRTQRHRPPAHHHRPTTASRPTTMAENNAHQHGGRQRAARRCSTAQRGRKSSSTPMGSVVRGRQIAAKNSLLKGRQRPARGGGSPTDIEDSSSRKVGRNGRTATPPSTTKIRTTCSPYRYVRRYVNCLVVDTTMMAAEAVRTTAQGHVLTAAYSGKIFTSPPPRVATSVATTTTE